MSVTAAAPEPPTQPFASPVKIETRDDGRIRIEAGFRDKERVKLVPGVLWDADRREWHAPMSWAALQQLRGVFQDRLQIGPQLERLSWLVWEHRVKPCLELRDAADAPWIDEPRLSPRQRAAVAFMVTAGQALEADPMGAGKTPITIAATRHLEDPFPMLVVCPNGVKPHWRNEYATWWDEARVAVVAGTAKKRRDAIEEVAAGRAQVAAINWESLVKHSRLARYGAIRMTDKDKEPKELNEIQWRTVVADEAHRAKDPKAKQTRALWAVGDPAEYRFALTGTPIANDPSDLWAIMRFVAPNEYPSKTKFLERYALMNFSYSGYLEIAGLRGEHREELFRFLDPRMIRRPKPVILPELKGKLPPVRRVVDLLPKQRKAYDSFRKELLVALDEGVLMASDPLQAFSRLRQLAAATGDEVKYEIEQTEDGPKQRVTMTLKEPSSKIDELVAVLEELGDDQAIVFAESRLLIELAAERLAKLKIPHVMFTGAIDEDEREANRVAFTESRTRVILGTYGAMAEGVNLATPESAAATIKLERSTSSIKDQQAEERGVRGQMKEPMRIIEIYAADTVDFDVANAVGEKLRMLEEVVRDEDAVRRLLGG